MEWIHFAYPWVGLLLAACIGAVAWYRWRYYKPVRYVYPLTDFLHQQHSEPSLAWLKPVQWIVRNLILLCLAAALAYPFVLDKKMNVHGQGIDIVMVMDVSGSMQLCDDEHDERSRLEIAKAQAIHFIEKRVADPIGLVFFGYNAVSRCPLTLDKKILTDIIRTTHLGVLDPSGTALGLGIVMGANRLKNAKSKSKVMILLTDGAPSAHDVPIQQAVAVAQELGIKIYTIGIGFDGVRYMYNPLGGVQAIQGVNKELLDYIAQQTGGTFFEAKNAAQMKKVYATIDALEKTTYETKLFARYHPEFQPFVGMAFCLFIIELLLAWVWFGL